MSQDIFPFDLAICLGLPLFAASVGVAGIWLWRRLSMRGFQSAIPMDDERIPLGSVSGARAKAEARANTIAQLIADITFAPTRH